MRPHPVVVRALDRQVAALREIRARFDTQSDSLLAPLVDYVAARGEKLKDGDLQKRIGKVMPRMLEGDAGSPRGTSARSSRTTRRAGYRSPLHMMLVCGRRTAPRLRRSAITWMALLHAANAPRRPLHDQRHAQHREDPPRDARGVALCSSPPRHGGAEPVDE